MKIFKITLLVALFFAVASTFSDVQASEIEIPITSQGYLKQAPSPKYLYNSGYLSLGLDTSTYKDGRTRTFVRYDLGSFMQNNIGIGDIESVTLDLWFYRSFTGAPSTFYFYVNPFNGMTSDYITWPEQLPITESTIERNVRKTPGMKEIDITPIVTSQLKNIFQTSGVILSLVNENQPAIWFYTNRCTLYNLFYGPQCEAHMIPKIRVTYNSTPPIPATILNTELTSIDLSSVLIEWEDQIENYYTVQISTDDQFDNIILSSDHISERSFQFTPESEGIYYFRIISTPNLESTLQSSSEIGIVTAKIIPGESPFDPHTDTPISNPPPVNTPNNDAKAIKDLINEPVKRPEQPTDQTKDKAKNDNPKFIAPEPEVMGTTIVEPPKDLINNKTIKNCEIEYKLLKNSPQIKCKGLVLTIDKVERISEQLLSIELSVPTKVKLYYKSSLCNIWKDLKHCEKSEASIDPHPLFTAEYDGRQIGIRPIVKSKNGEYVLSIETSSGPLKGKVKINARLILDDKNSTNIQSLPFSIPEPINIDNSNKPFRFPFDKPIGVTQWHGYTAFSKPHTGIDFGSHEETIYALGGGKIEAVGYDTYISECNSGGYYINIKHDNGYHSVYMHLKGNSIKHKKGDLVEKDEFIATSGNSGAYNCQPLGHHLHLETRTERSQSTHVDPVSAIAYNWELVPTLGYQSVPGRLTGDNPHPGR